MYALSYPSYDVCRVRRIVAFGFVRIFLEEFYVKVFGVEVEVGNRALVASVKCFKLGDLGRKVKAVADGISVSNDADYSAV